MKKEEVEIPPQPEKPETEPKIPEKPAEPTKPDIKTPEKRPIPEIPGN